MSENQVREAYTQMKQGNKKEAIRLVQNILREDRSNINAWWLFSHLIEDEEKIVKSLEKILALNPEHPGARKRLSQLRPEYANLTPTPAPLFKEKPAKPVKKGSSALAWLFGAVAFVVSAFIGFAVTSSMFGEMSFDPSQVEGHSPEEVAFLQLNAAFSGDYEAMRLYTCDSLEEEWEDIINSMKSQIESSGVDFSDVKFDLSGINLEQEQDNGRQIIYSVSGELSVEAMGIRRSVDILEVSGMTEARMVLVVNDNRWVVCSL